MKERSRFLRPAVIAAGSLLATALIAGAMLGATGCGTTSDGVSPSPTPAMRAAKPDEAQAALDRAAAALRAADRDAYSAALPASGPSARRALARLYEELAGLPWTKLRLVAAALDDAGRYDVRAIGELGRAGPADRLFAERVLTIKVDGGGLAVTADRTNPAVRSEYLSAFERPVVVRRNGLVVVADEAERARAEELADAGRAARKRLELLGITTRRPVMVYVFSSRKELRAMLGGGPTETRIRFFSHPPDRLGTTPSTTRDVGVLSPALDGKETWIPQMLAHELTHAYTVSWFAKSENAPTLLSEGLATAVEGGRSFQPLKDDLARKKPTLPLLTAIGLDDLWTDNPYRTVRLAYLEGSSLVLYVLDRWGLSDLRHFVAGVADSDLSERGVRRAVWSSLGLKWDRFHAGWKEYVKGLP